MFYIFLDYLKKLINDDPKESKETLFKGGDRLRPLRRREIKNLKFLNSLILFNNSP